MSDTSKKRSEAFLKIAGQFKLGALVTESSHPITADLSDVARQDISAALKLLFDVDGDVVNKFREFAGSAGIEKIAAMVLASVQNGGRIFFTGCGSTGRLSILLDSIWRGFWQEYSKNFAIAGPNNFENRVFSIMAGGDFALIKSVEGFEDFAAFGKKQIKDLGVSSKDIVFAITEGGETSFVIGTAWAGIEAGAKVYFIYNNPDEILSTNVGRSREVIQDPRIEKINLTTGPMAIAGSTRMQATSIQLCVMLAVLEIVVRELLGLESKNVPQKFLSALEELHRQLRSAEVLASLSKLVALEESVYRAGHKINYFAERFGIDVLTDTTERSPTFCTPPFRKFDDTTAAESWAFLFFPEKWTDVAWENILRRKPRCVDWNETEIRELVEAENVEKTLEIIHKISALELMRFKIGVNGIRFRPLENGGGAVAIISDVEKKSALTFQMEQLKTARKQKAKAGMILFGVDSSNEIERSADVSLFVPIPQTNFLLDGVTRVAVKLVMNALSTCTMVRLGRVMGNCMIYVVPSNLKLIDRATRYVSRLADLSYERANELLFEVIEHVEPRIKSDQAYPPVVRTAVLRARENLSNEDAEKHLR